MTDKNPLTQLSKVNEIMNVKLGDTPKGLMTVQNYLQRFGYLDSDDYERGVYDKATLVGLQDFQRRFNLSNSGVFDSETKALMQLPRCGITDTRMSFRFSLTCCWDKRQLLYAFDNGTDQVAGNQEFGPIRAAINTWMEAVEVDFIEVGPGDSPDVLIGWRTANDPDYSMIGSVVAHADFPPDCSVVANNLPKPIHFDDTEHNWVIGAVPSGLDIETVALHEIGHILGLAHSSEMDAVMAPFVRFNSTKRELTNDDIKGVRQLYPTVPFVQELSVSIAADLVRAAGLVPRIIGPNNSNASVFRQSPRGGRAADCFSTVTLQTRTGPIL
ncbi:matrixin family metalloprotease [Acaryochloris sp. IP29b_bin.148]|uniref:matrixin family metalloprotease n=1 Tax=Acaryochloris sp. IP29b_bin.148 TaxID=2969218 RepID=UPI00261AE676|nr:matrixin family metalloprotease [Acaryochloris sp. IP29b_bin.148]